MDIKDVMKDGKIDLHKVYKETSNFVEFGGTHECFTAHLIKVINAHIASLTQETPITPELLQRVGAKMERKNAGHWLVSIPSEGWYLTTFHMKTMEDLEAVFRVDTGKTLNWQHGPAAEVKKRLEAMGFTYDPQWRKHVVNIDYMRIVVDCDYFGVSAAFKPFGIYNKLHEIKTIDQLEKLVGVLKGE